MIGQTLSHYKILAKLGEGGMGVVYKAEDCKLKRPVALKFLPSHLTRDQEALARFIYEAQTASSLDHQNLCTIHEIDETPSGQMFICMAYYEGETLKKKIAGDQLAVSSVVAIALQVAQGLAKAHEKGIIHRDLKPSNIIVQEDGAVKIIDFSLSKLVGARELTQSGVIMGTTAYLSPEQASGEAADRRTDIWSLGVVLYEMLTGQLPFKGELMPAVIYTILNEAPEPLHMLRPETPPALQRVVEKALHKDPNARYQDAAELLADLQASTPERATRFEREKQKAMAARHWDNRRLRFISIAAILVLLLGIGLVLWRLPQAQEATLWPERHRIAVLPLLNISSDPQNEYFAEGLTEELISTLSQIARFRVIARTSVMRYKGATKDIAAIGRELQVGTILEGSVRLANGKLRITAQLIDVRREEPFWSRDYDRELKDVFAIQSDIAQRVAEALQAELPPSEKKSLARKATENLAAYTAYLKGRYFWNKRTAADLQKSIAQFEQAIAHDSSYALAYAGLADAYSVLGTVEYGALPGREAATKAMAAATKGLTHDEQCAEAHTAHANILFTYEWNWAGAEREFQRAIALNPNYAVAHHWYAHLLAAWGRFEEAQAEIKFAQELDPLSLIVNTAAGMLWYYKREPEEAIAQLRKTLEMDSNFVAAQLQLGVVYAHERRFEEALTQLQNASRRAPLNPLVLALLGYAHAAAGNKKEAQAILAQLQNTPLQPQAAAVYFALVDLGLGEHERVFAYLEQARVERANYLVYLKVEPLVEGLRSDPRFAELLRKVGLEED